MDGADSSTEKAYRLDEQVGYLLRLANQRHAAIFQTHAPAGLTPTQFAAMIRLAEHGELSQNQLGRMAAMDIATIKGVVDRLSRKGYLRKAPSPEDRRRSMVSLTEEGRALIDELERRGRTISRETLQALSGAERATFLRLLRRLA